MGPVIGEMLPLALGIAISPTPVVATIIMLLSPKGKGTSIGFLIGWVGGIALMTSVFALLSSLLPNARPQNPTYTVGFVEIGLGLLLIALAVRQWLRRPRPGDDAPLPRWVKAIDSLTFWRGLAIGFVYSAFRPKNLAISLAAGVVIGSAGLEVLPAVLATAIFTVVAASTIAAPVVAYFGGRHRVTSTLEETREWLLRNVGTITSVALLFLGIVVFGMGIGQF